MNNDFMQILMAGIGGGANQVVTSDAADKKLTAQLGLDKQKRLQSFQDNLALKMIDPTKNNPNIMDLDSLAAAYPNLAPLLNTLRPKPKTSSKPKTKPFSITPPTTEKVW